MYNLGGYVSEGFYRDFHYEITSYTDPVDGQIKLEYCIYGIDRGDGGWNDGYTWGDYQDGSLVWQIKDVIDRR